MIFYFSATGNSKYTAQQIANALGDKAVSLEHHNGRIQLSEKECLGIVTPVYFWALPKITREFLEKLVLETTENHYFFIVITYGTTSGCCGKEARHILKEKNIVLNGIFHVKMPDNWTPFFDLSNPQKVQKRNNQAEIKTQAIIFHIQKRQNGNFTRPNTPYFLKGLTTALFDKARQTEKFYVEESCIGCGLCVKRCPVQAIELKDNKPVWIKKQCELCLRCLHTCPKFSIQYGNGTTKKHGQYKHPDFKP